MRSRDEVVVGSYRYTRRDHGWTMTHVDHDNQTPVSWPHTVEMLDRIRELEAQVEELTLNRMADADAEALGEFLSQYDLQRTAPEAASGEPVAWALHHDGYEGRPWMDMTSNADVAANWERYYPGRIVPLYSSPLSAAGVSDEALEAAAAAFYHEQYGAQGGRYELVNPDHRHVWRDKARAVLTAAREVQSS